MNVGVDVKVLVRRGREVSIQRMGNLSGLGPTFILERPGTGGSGNFLQAVYLCREIEYHPARVEHHI